MDSDAEELGHVRMALKEPLGLRTAECDDAFLHWQQCRPAAVQRGRACACERTACWLGQMNGRRTERGNLRRSGVAGRARSRRGAKPHLHVRPWPLKLTWPLRPTTMWSRIAMP